MNDTVNIQSPCHNEAHLSVLRTWLLAHSAKRAFKHNYTDHSTVKAIDIELARYSRPEATACTNLVEIVVGTDSYHVTMRTGRPNDGKG
jgi:hypothetical protein